MPRSGGTMGSLNIYQDRARSMSNAQCEATRQVIQQRRQFNFFNVPMSRLRLISPYPKFTQEQLNMRRKVEVLKYSNNTSTTKTNNFTKRQQWAMLATGVLSQPSQYQIAKADAVTMCSGDQYLPTWTTACGVPGPPMILQYDPKVPLYNYVSESVNRTYGTSMASSILPDEVFKNYTINELFFIQDTYMNLRGDFGPLDPYYIDSLNPTFEMTSSPMQIGSIQILYNMTEPMYSFNVSCPVGFWLIGTKGQGIYDTSGCPEDVVECPDSAILKRPGVFNAGDNVRIQISYITAQVMYNDTVVRTIRIDNAGTNAVDISYNQFIDVSFNAHTDVADLREFYGIQYVGMVNVSVPMLPTAPGNVYTITGTATYSYTLASVKKFDVFKTGVFFNLSESVAPTTVDDMSFQSVAPTNYSSGSNDFFDYGDPPVTFIDRIHDPKNNAHPSNNVI